MVYQDLNLNKQPLATVVIITYNQEKLVSQTIESILSQECSFRFEIIIAEDCSQDHTLDVCLHYYHKHPEIIRVVSNDNNKGLIRNFHETLSDYARGKYILGVAGDDWWHDSRKIQKQVSFLETNPDYGLVYSDTLVFCQETKKYQKYKPSRPRCSFNQLIVYNCIPALTACYRKCLFDQYLEDVNPVIQNFPGEDYPMWIWFAHQSKVFHIDAPLTTYRLQRETLSHSLSKQRILQFEIDRLDIKMFFYRHFNLCDLDILHDIYLVFYFLTLNSASEANRKDIEEEREKFFRENKHFLLLLLSKLNGLFSHIDILSNILKFVLKVCQKFRLLDKSYRANLC